MVGSHGVCRRQTQDHEGDLTDRGVEHEILFPDLHTGNCQWAEVLIDAENDLVFLKPGVEITQLDGIVEVFFHPYPARKLVGAVTMAAVTMGRVIPNHHLSLGMQPAKIFEGTVVKGYSGQDLARSGSGKTDTVVGRPPVVGLMILGRRRGVVKSRRKEGKIDAVGPA
jgi:hypothetical protein